MSRSGMRSTFHGSFASPKRRTPGRGASPAMRGSSIPADPAASRSPYIRGSTPRKSRQSGWSEAGGASHPPQRLGSGLTDHGSIKPRTPRSDHAFLAATAAFQQDDDTMGTHDEFFGIPSSSDPNKKYWLRKEVIGFEREMVRLKEETQLALEYTQRCRTEQEQSRTRTTNLKAMIVMKKGEVQRLQDENTKTLRRELSKRDEEAGCVENKVTKMNEEEEKMKVQIEQLEAELSVYRHEIELNGSNQQKLDSRCHTMTSDLQVMLENPIIPADYKMMVDAAESAQLATVTDLEERIREYYHKIEAAQVASLAIAETTQCILEQRDSAHKAVAAAQTNVALELSELRKLSHKKHSIRDKIQHLPIRKVVKEVVKEVVVEKYPAVPFSNEFIMEKCFDEVATTEGFAHTGELISRVRTLSSFDSSLVSLLHAVEDLSAAVVDRDDFIELVLMWRKHGYHKTTKKASPSKATTAKAHSPKHAQDELMVYFDHADDQGLGFAERESLADYLEAVAAHREVSMLVKLIRAERLNVIERALFESILQRWRRGETVPIINASWPEAHAAMRIEVDIDVKIPAVEMEVKAPEVCIAAKVKVPAVECEVEVEVKAPSFEVKAPSVQAQSFEVEVEVKAPSFEVEVEPPKMPSVECEVEISVPSAHIHVSGHAAMCDDDLLYEFDKVDPDCTGFAPREELIQHMVEICKPQDPSIGSLIEMLKVLDVMILEREDFGELLTKWRESSECGAGVAFSDDDLCNEFDKVDEDETGFAARLDLRVHLETNILPHMPSIASLIGMIMDLDAMILEKDEFEELLEEWRSSLN